MYVTRERLEQKAREENTRGSRGGSGGGRRGAVTTAAIADPANVASTRWPGGQYGECVGTEPRRWGAASREFDRRRHWQRLAGGYPGRSVQVDSIRICIESAYGFSA